MKKAIFLFSFLIMVICPSFASIGFYAEYKMSSVEGSKDMNGSMKIYSSVEGNSRSEVNMMLPGSPNGGMSLVSIHKKAEPSTIYMLFTSSKSYSKSDISKYSGSTASDAKYEVKVIGIETVNGYSCTHIKIFKEGKEMEDLWMSKEVAGYQGMDMGSSKYMPSGSLANELKAKGVEGMMVRILVEENASKVQIDLIKAEKRELVASLFLVPADYTETTTVGGMMKEMNMPTMDEMMKMTPADREYWIKKLEQKYK